MRSVNKVILIGNLTRDPAMKETENGQPIATFGMATNREWVTKNSEKRSLAEFHNVVAWGKLAEICTKFLKKGKLVYVEGYLKTRSWDTANGVRVFKTEIVIYDMIMLDKRPNDYVPEEGAESFAADMGNDLSMEGDIFGDMDSSENSAESTPEEKPAEEVAAESTSEEASADVEDEVSKMTGEAA